MNHERRYQRSLAMHRFLCQRLKDNPELLPELRKRQESYNRNSDCSPKYLKAWTEAIDKGIAGVLALALEDSEWGQVIRSCSPMAFLWKNPKERLIFLKEWAEEDPGLAQEDGKELKTPKI